MSAAAPAEVAAPGDEALAARDGVPGPALGGNGAATGPEVGRGRLRRFWFVPAGVALLGAAALVPSVGGGGPGAGEARVLVDGVAVVTDVDGDATTVRDDRIDVGPGDEVVVTEGRAVFEMADGVRLEGLGPRDGAADEPTRGAASTGTTVEMAIAPRLVTGRLLAEAPVPLEIEAGDATVAVAPAGSVEGAVRLDRRLGLGVGTYRGQVSVDSAGRQADVPRYRRVEVAAPGALSAEGRPLRYAADDPWDRRFLGEALVIDAQIAPLLAALGEDRGDVFLDPATLRDAVPGVPRGSGLAERLDDVADGGTALVLAAIATAVEDRSFATAWDRADAFQADGALWGLAALDQGARSSDVLPLLRAALDTLDLQAPIGRSATDAADEGGPGDEPTTTDAATTDPGTPGAGAGETAAAPGGSTAGGVEAPASTTAPVPGAPPAPGAPAPPPPSAPAPPAPNPPGPPPPPVPHVPDVVRDVGDTVGGVVDGVTDVVDHVLPGAGQAVDGIVGGTSDIVAGLGGAVGGLAGAAGPVLGPVVSGLGEVVGSLGTGLGAGVRTPAAG